MTKWSQANCRYYPFTNLGCVCYVTTKTTTKIITKTTKIR